MWNFPRTPWVPPPRLDLSGRDSDLRRVPKRTPRRQLPWGPKSATTPNPQEAQLAPVPKSGVDPMQDVPAIKSAPAPKLAPAPKSVPAPETPTAHESAPASAPAPETATAPETAPAPKSRKASAPAPESPDQIMMLTSDEEDDQTAASMSTQSNDTILPDEVLGEMIQAFAGLLGRPWPNIRLLILVLYF